MKMLLIIDMQEGFRYPEVEQIIPAIKRAISRFEGLVAFTQFHHDSSSNFERQLNWNKFNTPQSRRIMTELINRDFPVFKHTTYSVVTEEVFRFMRQREVSTVFVCGIYTDVCVKMGAMELFDRGIGVKVIKDACASPHGTKIHQSSLESLSHILGAKNIIDLSAL